MFGSFAHISTYLILLYPLPDFTLLRVLNFLTHPNQLFALSNKAVKSEGGEYHAGHHPWDSIIRYLPLQVQVAHQTVGGVS